MPNGVPDDQPVTWGRWYEAHQAVLRRLDELDTYTEQQFRRIEANERAVVTADQARAQLADDVKDMSASVETRRGRQWTLVTILLMSFLMPLLVTLLVTYVHLRLSH
jgi:hypothetical protein